MFAAAARHLNITRASQELHVSQPSVSQQLKLLEQSCSLKLFRKVRNGIELTEAGQLFLQRIDAILKQVEELEKTFPNAVASSQPESLAVGGSYVPSAWLLPKLLANFKNSHSKVQLTFRTGSAKSILRLVEKGEIEMAVVSNPKPSPDVFTEPFRREKLVGFAPAGHRLARRRAVRVAQLARVPLVIIGKGGGGATEQMLRQIEDQGLKPSISLRCETPNEVKMAVRNHMGVGILYDHSVEPELHRGDFKLLNISDLDLAGESCIVYRKGQSFSPAGRAFLRLLRKSAAKPVLALRSSRRSRSAFLPAVSTRRSAVRPKPGAREISGRKRFGAERDMRMSLPRGEKF